MADQFSGDIYLVQKNIYYPDVSIYKVGLSMDLLLNIPAPWLNIMAVVSNSNFSRRLQIGGRIVILLW